MRGLPERKKLRIAVSVMDVVPPLRTKIDAVNGVVCDVPSAVMVEEVRVPAEEREKRGEGRRRRMCG